MKKEFHMGNRERLYQGLAEGSVFRNGKEKNKR